MNIRRRLSAARGLEGTKSKSAAIGTEIRGELKVLRRLEGQLEAAFISSWDLPLVNAALRKQDESNRVVTKAADERTGWIVSVGVDPAFDDLRSEREFQKLKQQVRIPEA